MPDQYGERAAGCEFAAPVARRLYAVAAIIAGSITQTRQCWARGVIGRGARRLLDELHRGERNVLLPWTRRDLHAERQSRASVFAFAGKPLGDVARGPALGLFAGAQEAVDQCRVVLLGTPAFRRADGGFGAVVPVEQHHVLRKHDTTDGRRDRFATHRRHAASIPAGVELAKPAYELLAESEPRAEPLRDLAMPRNTSASRSPSVANPCTTARMSSKPDACGWPSLM
jgi:hypothetical protein